MVHKPPKGKKNNHLLLPHPFHTHTQLLALGLSALNNHGKVYFQLKWTDCPQVSFLTLDSMLHPSQLLFSPPSYAKEFKFLPTVTLQNQVKCN